MMKGRSFGDYPEAAGEPQTLFLRRLWSAILLREVALPVSEKLLH